MGEKAEEQWAQHTALRGTCIQDEVCIPVLTPCGAFVRKSPQEQRVAAGPKHLRVQFVGNDGVKCRT